MFQKWSSCELLSLNVQISANWSSAKPHQLLSPTEKMTSSTSKSQSSQMRVITRELSSCSLPLASFEIHLAIMLVQCMAEKPSSARGDKPGRRKYLVVMERFQFCRHLLCFVVPPLTSLLLTGGGPSLLAFQYQQSIHMKHQKWSAKQRWACLSEVSVWSCSEPSFSAKVLLEDQVRCPTYFQQ